MLLFFWKEGMDPFEIQMGQTALGRRAHPTMRPSAPAPPAADESVVVNQALLEEIIEEEILKLLGAPK